MYLWLLRIFLRQELLADQKIESLEDMKNAAKKLHDLGAPAVIIKGGNRRQSG